jgi:chloramphenicol-sensitive protein RarD
MDKQTKQGYLITFISYFFWGVIPIYWKQLKAFPPLELLSARIIVTAMTLMIVVMILKKNDLKTYWINPQIRRGLLFSSCLIGLNWGIFVYAVNAGYMVQASLGYYINPLLSVFFGIFIMRERLTKMQYLSLILALVGVLYMTLSYGKFPWIAIILALSFGLYGLLKKLYHLDSISSLLGETLVLLPIAFIVLIFSQSTSNWMQQVPLIQWLWMFLAGLITAIPLLLFSEGAKRIPMSAIGFLQYIAPTLMLMIGVFGYNEKFTQEHMISFTFIWSGLLLYSLSLRKRKQSSEI